MSIKLNATFDANSTTLSNRGIQPMRMQGERYRLLKWHNALKKTPRIPSRCLIVAFDGERNYITEAAYLRAGWFTDYLRNKDARVVYWTYYDYSR